MKLLKGIFIMVEKAIILGAGFGTRMGELGKTVPKVLWPVFDKTLLELQVFYLKELGIKEIFLNTHHQHEKIQKFVDKKKLNITILHEKEILGPGGAIHNCARSIKRERGYLLVCNGDSFYFFNKENKKKIINSLKFDSTLLSVDVSGHYSEIVCDKDSFYKEIKKKESRKIYKTYSGVGFINLETLQLKEGKSFFFESVILKENKNHVYSPDGAKFYDFGELDKYKKLCFELLEKVSHPSFSFIVDFLIRSKALDVSKINLDRKSYNSLKRDEIVSSDGFIISREEIFKSF